MSLTAVLDPTVAVALLLTLPAGVAARESPATGQEPSPPPAVAAPTPARPDASAPVRPEVTSSPTGEAGSVPAAELAAGERWATVVPVLLWWAGEGMPRLQVCSEDFGDRVGDPCPIEGAPPSVRSLQLECRGWDCSKLPMRQAVEVRAVVEDGRIVALGRRP